MSSLLLETGDILLLETGDELLLEDPVALASGVASSSVLRVAVSLVCTAAIGGSGSYTYQWHRSASTGFTPSGGTAIGGATTLTYSDTAPSAGVWYYKCVVDDGLTSANSNQTSVTAWVVGRVFYVSSAGNDSNDGLSTGASWLTIAKVNAGAIYGGDTVSFNGGDTFSGTIVPPRSGDATHGSITFNSYGTGNAILSPGSGNGITISDLDYLAFAHLNIVGPGVNSNGTMVGVGTGSSGVFATCSGSIPLGPLSFTDVNISGMYRGYWFVTTHASAPKGWVGLRATNFTVHDCMTVGFLWIATGGFRQTFSDWAITNFNIYNIYADASNTTNSYIGSGMRGSDVDGCTIGPGVIHDTGANNACVVGGGPGSAYWVRCNNLLVTGVEAYNSFTLNEDGAGLDLDGGNVDCVIEHCYVHDVYSSGIMIGGFGGSLTNDNCIVRYCVVENCCTSSVAPSVHGGLRFFNSATGILQNCWFHNNTVYMGSGGAATDAGMAVDSSAGTQTNCGWLNNIIYTNNRLQVAAASGSTTGYTFRGNSYYDADGTPNFSWAGVSTTSLASFRSSTTLEKNGATNYGNQGDPLLSAVGTGGTLYPAAVSTLTAYNLTASSPAVNPTWTAPLSDFSLTAQTTDFRGYAIPVGVYDAGASEFGAAAAAVVANRPLTPGARMSFALARGRR